MDGWDLVVWQDLIDETAARLREVCELARAERLEEARQAMRGADAQIDWMREALEDVLYPDDIAREDDVPEDDGLGPAPATGHCRCVVCQRAIEAAASGDCG